MSCTPPDKAPSRPGDTTDTADPKFMRRRETTALASELPVSQKSSFTNTWHLVSRNKRDSNTLKRKRAETHAFVPDSQGVSADVGTTETLLLAVSDVEHAPIEGVSDVEVGNGVDDPFHHMSVEDTTTTTEPDQTTEPVTSNATNVSRVDTVLDLGIVPPMVMVEDESKKELYDEIKMLKAKMLIQLQRIETQKIDLSKSHEWVDTIGAWNATLRSGVVSRDIEIENLKTQQKILEEKFSTHVGEDQFNQVSLLKTALNNVMYAQTFGETEDGPQLCAVSQITLLPSEPVFRFGCQNGCSAFVKERLALNTYSSFLNTESIKCLTCSKSLIKMDYTTVAASTCEEMWTKVRQLTVCADMPTVFMRHNEILKKRKQVECEQNTAPYRAMIGKIKGLTCKTSNDTHDMQDYIDQAGSGTTPAAAVAE